MSNVNWLRLGFTKEEVGQYPNGINQQYLFRALKGFEISILFAAENIDEFCQIIFLLKLILALTLITTIEKRGCQIIKQIILGSGDLRDTKYDLYVMSEIPYARHYNPRFVYFLPHFYIEVRFILQTTYGLKTEILYFLSLKSAVYIRERFLIESGL